MTTIRMVRKRPRFFPNAVKPELKQLFARSTLTMAVVRYDPEFAAFQQRFPKTASERFARLKASL